MQKVINVLAVLSFVGVAGIIGGGTYVYTQRDTLIENAKEKIASAATEAIAGALPGMLEMLCLNFLAQLVVQVREQREEVFLVSDADP